MNRRKKKYSKYKQGIYKPTDQHKYKGKSNPRYLSSWELKFFRWCDNNPSVVEWTSESIIIPYISPIDGRAHRYMVDNKVIIREGDKLAKYLIEIKPFKQTRKPTSHGNKKKSTILYENLEYVRNQAKWEAARKWCDKHGYKFQILTERELFR
jgi:hypothetical protein